VLTVVDVSKRNRRAKKTAFVPRGIFANTLAAAAVVPMCVAGCGGQALGGRNSSGAASGGVASGAFSGNYGVAASGFGSSGEFTVAASGFSFSVASGAFGVAASGFSVANVALAAFDGGTADCGNCAAADAAFSGAPDADAIGADVGDGSSGDEGLPDATFTVASLGFDGAGPKDDGTPEDSSSGVADGSSGG